MAFPEQEIADMEGLLEDSPQPVPNRLPRHLAALGAALALGGVAVVGLSRGNVLRASTAALVGLDGLDAVPEGCFKKGMFYTGPHIMPGTVKTLEESAEACQSKCVDQDSCAHFTFWPDGGCLLTSNSSYLKAAGYQHSQTTIGPKDCSDLAEFEVFKPEGAFFCEDEAVYNGPSAGAGECELKCDDQASCEYYSIWSTGGENWCKLTTACDTVGADTHHTIAIYKKKPKAQVEAAVSAPAPAAEATAAATKGVNGTTCSAYPACVAVGISEGSCCPNDAGVALGCCNGFPPAVQVVAVAAGSECSAAAGCVALNLTEGGCCPTATGIRLGCCDA